MILRIVARIFALGFLIVMTLDLIAFAIDPSLRYSIGEPNRWVSIIEVVMGVTAIAVLYAETIALLKTKLELR